MRDRTEHRPGIASFRAVLEAVPDAIVVSDEQGQILLVNSQTERLFGYAREQLIRQPTEMLILEQFREHHARHRKEYLQRPHTRLMDSGLEVVGQRADGSEFPVEICLSLLQEEAGMFICHAIRDLTERQRYENTLKWTAAELTRTNAELEQLAYAASHDLQEPLRTVVGATQILGRDYSSKLDPEAREWLVFATEGAKRMQELLNALLEYARLGTRRRPFELVDCEKIYQAAVANLKLSIEESEAEVTHGPLPMVLGDGVQLIQLFQNLLSNALKFRRPDRPRVHVSAQPEQNHWRVCVRDNGIGIDPKHFNRIFSLFQRLHTREQFPGAGIGLAICKKIVEQHGGRIGVESKPGEGSNFFFSIPMVETQALPASPFTGTSGALA
jgi:PAS domain S-box-containing protein